MSMKMISIFTSSPYHFFCEFFLLRFFTTSMEGYILITHWHVIFNPKRKEFEMTLNQELLKILLECILCKLRQISTIKPVSNALSVAVQSELEELQ